MPLDRADRNSSALSQKQEAAFLAPLVLTLPTLAMTLGLKLGADRCHSGLDES